MNGTGQLRLDNNPATRRNEQMGIESETIRQIINWLKQHGEESDEGTNFRFSGKDEPYMDFSFEWQQHGGGELLFVGYSNEESGDICNDPEFRFHITGGQIEKIIHNHWMYGDRPCESAEDRKYAFEFADLLYKRHLRTRSGVGDREKQPHLGEAFDILCRLVQDGKPVPPEIVVPLEDDNRLTWKTTGLLEAVKQQIAASA
jgi:hypothetical protein